MLCIGVTNLLGISAILANMVIGFIVVNFILNKVLIKILNIRGIRNG